METESSPLQPSNRSVRPKRWTQFQRLDFHGVRCPDFSVIQMNEKSYCTSSPPCSLNIRQQLSCAKTGTSLERTRSDSSSDTILAPHPPVSFSYMLFEWMWCAQWPTHCSSASVLLAVALYDINTAIFVPPPRDTLEPHRKTQLFFSENCFGQEMPPSLRAFF